MRRCLKHVHNCCFRGERVVEDICKFVNFGLYNIDKRYVSRRLMEIDMAVSMPKACYDSFCIIDDEAFGRTATTLNQAFVDSSV